MSKHIVFCADGTWNTPNEDQNRDQTPDPTNVYKLFTALAGTMTPPSLLLADEQEKELVEAGLTTQVAKYIHGVGDSRNPIIKLMGGAFGAGTISRIVRGYTFLSRNYQPGDQITIVGFSRGAYTARALAGLIANQGLLNTPITSDKSYAYRCGAQAWYRYRKSSLKNRFSLAHLGEIVADLPAFLSQGSLTDTDFVPVDAITAVGVFDTVGAMGFPDYAAGGERVDAFKFADTQLSVKVQRGFHAVALDERRSDFVPTLWDPAERIVQVLFPGAHGDVGGGYPTTNRESGLSDLALAWMLAQLETVGVRFAADAAATLQPDAGGLAHQPWAHLPWTLPGVALGPRQFSAGVAVAPAVSQRSAAGVVVAEPGATAAPYNPSNLP